jgi:hypothetical protein
MVAGQEKASVLLMSVEGGKDAARHGCATLSIQAAAEKSWLPGRDETHGS